MKSETDCLFCKIATKTIPAKIVYEDDHTVAFLDVMPRAPGHTMVVSKYHEPTLAVLPEDEVGSLFLAVKKTVELLMMGLHPDGVTIGINQGRASGQVVDHLHVHLMPRWQGDGGSPVQSVVSNAPQEPLDEILKKILNGAKS